MKICIVVDAFPRVSETFVLHQVLGLQARGHHVEVLCRQIDRKRFDTSPETAAMRRHTRRWWGPLGFADVAMAPLSPKYHHKAAVALDRFAAAHLRRFDVVLAHFGFEGARVADLWKRRGGMPPLVTIFHGYDVAIAARTGEMGVFDTLFRVGAAHLTVNRTFRDLLVAAGAPPDRTQVHHMGIPLDAFPFHARDFGDRSPRFLSVCRLTEKKGIEDALRALSLLRGARPDLDWSYRIVGDGHLRGRLEALARELSLEDRVQFLGAQPHREVRRLLFEAHCFLLPSVTAPNGDAEGIPVSLMEAMASGAVAVSTVHSGIPELIEDGVTGFLAPEGDPAALSDRLLRIVDDPSSLGPVAQAARAQVERNFSLDRMLDDLEDRLARLRPAGRGADAA